VHGIIFSNGAFWFLLIILFANGANGKRSHDVSRCDQLPSNTSRASWILPFYFVVEQLSRGYEFGSCWFIVSNGANGKRSRGVSITYYLQLSRYLNGLRRLTLGVPFLFVMEQLSCRYHFQMLRDCIRGGILISNAPFLFLLFMPHDRRNARMKILNDMQLADSSF